MFTIANKGCSFLPQNSHREKMLGAVQTSTKIYLLKLFKKPSNQDRRIFFVSKLRSYEGSSNLPEIMKGWWDTAENGNQGSALILKQPNFPVACYFSCPEIGWITGFSLFHIVCLLVVLLLWWRSCLRHLYDQSLNLHDFFFFLNALVNVFLSEQM